MRRRWLVGAMSRERLHCFQLGLIDHDGFHSRKPPATIQ